MSPYILWVQDERTPALAEEHKSRTTDTSPTKVAIKNAPKVLSRDGAGGSKAEGSTGAAVGGADMTASCVLAASTLDDDAIMYMPSFTLLCERWNLRGHMERAAVRWPLNTGA